MAEVTGKINTPGHFVRCHVDDCQREADFVIYGSLHPERGKCGPPMKVSVPVCAHCMQISSVAEEASNGM